MKAFSATAGVLRFGVFEDELLANVVVDVIDFRPDQEKQGLAVHAQLETWSELPSPEMLSSNFSRLST